MAIRVLIIDDTAYFRLLVRHMLGSAMPKANLVEYDPAVQGRPGKDFDWTKFDVLLLDYNLGEEDGLEWFKDFKDSPNFPATIIFTGEGNESLAVRAMKAGVADYLPKADLIPERLAKSVKEAHQNHRTRISELQTDSVMTQVTPMPASAVISNSKCALDVPGYRVLKHIGSGATACTYLVEKEETGQQMVIKVLNPELKNKRDLLQRFLTEYRLISEIDNRHIVKIHDRGFTEDHCFIALEYLSGGDLRERIRQGMTAKQALASLAQLTIGLHAMHKRNIVHRDIKPENIMFRADDSLAIVDFGIARQLEHESGLTRHGEIYGTPHYISPEQISGEKADARSDLYSLGVVFFEMLTGSRPYKADTLYNLFFKQMKEPVPTLTGNLAIFNSTLDKLLKHDPEQRYPNAATLFLELKMKWGAKEARRNAA